MSASRISHCASTLQIEAGDFNNLLKQDPLSPCFSLHPRPLGHPSSPGRLTTARGLALASRRVRTRVGLGCLVHLFSRPGQHHTRGGPYVFAPCV